jgi:hypothetical protein
MAISLHWIKSRDELIGIAGGLPCLSPMSRSVEPFSMPVKSFFIFGKLPTVYYTSAAVFSPEQDHHS